MISSPHVALRRPVLQKCTALRSELAGTIFVWSPRVGGHWTPRVPQRWALWAVAARASSITAFSAKASGLPLNAVRLLREHAA